MALQNLFAFAYNTLNLHIIQLSKCDKTDMKSKLHTSLYIYIYDDSHQSLFSNWMRVVWCSAAFKEGEGKFWILKGGKYSFELKRRGFKIVSSQNFTLPNPNQSISEHSIRYHMELHTIYLQLQAKARILPWQHFWVINSPFG